MLNAESLYILFCYFSIFNVICTLHMFPVKGAEHWSIKVLQDLIDELCRDYSEVSLTMFTKSHSQVRPFRTAAKMGEWVCLQQIYPVCAVRLWNSLPQEVVMASGLDAFKRGLDRLMEKKSTSGYKL